MKKDFKEFIEKEDCYFSEGHLYGWFDDEYIGKDINVVKHNLKVNHDISGEVENAENELDRNLSDREKDQLKARFNEAVVNSLVVHNEVVVAFVDSLGETKVKGNHG